MIDYKSKKTEIMKNNRVKLPKDYKTGWADINTSSRYIHWEAKNDKFIITAQGDVDNDHLYAFRLYKLGEDGDRFGLGSIELNSNNSFSELDLKYQDVINENVNKLKYLEYMDLKICSLGEDIMSDIKKDTRKDWQPSDLINKYRQKEK